MGARHTNDGHATAGPIPRRAAGRICAAAPLPDGATTAIIGPEGGRLSLGAATIAIPPGALTQPTTISISVAVEPPPSGYAAYSPLYYLAPADTRFARPVTVTLPFAGDPSLAAVFRTLPSAGGYQRLGGDVQGSTITTSSTQLRDSFVAQCRA